MGQISRKQQLAFLLFNLLYFSIGAGMIGVGVYNILVLQGFSIFARQYYTTGGVIFVFVGAAKVILSLLGILGMVLQQRVLLTIYVIVFGLTVLPTLAAGVFGLQQWFFVYDDVGETMQSVYNSSTLFNETATLRQSFRQNYYCCGIEQGQSDYNNIRNTNLSAELASCTRAMIFRLVNNTKVATQLGCQWYVADDIRYHLNYIGSIGLGFGFFELTALIVAMQNMEGVI